MAKQKQTYNLPQYQEEPEYQEKVETAKGPFVGLSTAELAREFKRTRLLKKDLEEQVSSLNIELLALSQLLVNDLQGQELSKVTLDSGGTVYLKTEVYPATTDKALVRVWAIEAEMPEILTVNYRTLQSIVKERLQEGLDLPPGVAAFLKISAHYLS